METTRLEIWLSVIVLRLIQLLSSLQFPESLVSNTINFTRNVVTPEQAFDDLLLKIDVER